MKKAAETPLDDDLRGHSWAFQGATPAGASRQALGVMACTTKNTTTGLLVELRRLVRGGDGQRDASPDYDSEWTLPRLVEVLAKWGAVDAQGWIDREAIWLGAMAELRKRRVNPVAEILGEARALRCEGWTVPRIARHFDLKKSERYLDDCLRGIQG